MMACGENWNGGSRNPIIIGPYSSRLTAALLLHGADVNAKETGEWTALYYAVAFRPDKTIIQQLLTYGADPDIAAVCCGPAIRTAELHHHPDIASLLRKYSKHP